VTRLLNASAANASGFLLVSLSKTPRIYFLPFQRTAWPRRFRSRLATIRTELVQRYVRGGRCPTLA
jgi:hypothetical protein